MLNGAWKAAEAAPLALALPALGPPLARLSARAGQPATASQVAAALSRLADGNPQVPRLRAAAQWAAGIAASDPALLLDAAAAQRQGAARPLDLAMIREDAAAALAEKGDAARAGELLREALAGYDALGARQRAFAARARLRALGVRAGATGRRGRPATGWEALTAAEAQVTELVAGRLSNPEIAERLFLSRRTVETHVARARAKLGCASRRELIAAAQRHLGGTAP